MQTSSRAKLGKSLSFFISRLKRSREGIVLLRNLGKISRRGPNRATKIGTNKKRKKPPPGPPTGKLRIRPARREEGK